MSLPAFWAALALCGWASGSAPAGAPPDSGDIVALAAPSTATLLGEPVVVQATARLAAAESLALDLQRSTTDNMAITSIRELAPTAAVRRFELSIVPLDLGSRVFPIYWTLTSAGSTRTLSTNLRLDVREPPGAAHAQDIKDIKPPRNAWPRLWPWLLLAAAALGAWGWARWGSRRDRSSVAATDGGADIRPPEVIAEEDHEVDDVGAGHDLGDLHRLDELLFVYPSLGNDEDLAHIGQQAPAETGGPDHEGGGEEPEVSGRGLTGPLAL